MATGRWPRCCCRCCRVPCRGKTRASRTKSPRPSRPQARAWLLGGVRVGVEADRAAPMEPPDWKAKGLVRVELVLAHQIALVAALNDDGVHGEVPIAVQGVRAGAVPGEGTRGGKQRREGHRQSRRGPEEIPEGRTQRRPHARARKDVWAFRAWKVLVSMNGKSSKGPGCLQDAAGSRREGEPWRQGLTPSAIEGSPAVSGLSHVPSFFEDRKFPDPTGGSSPPEGPPSGEPPGEMLGWRRFEPFGVRRVPLSSGSCYKGEPAFPV